MEIKIGDFGISKKLIASIEMTTTVIGSLNHLSPERAKMIPYDQKSDIWYLFNEFHAIFQLYHEVFIY